MGGGGDHHHHEPFTVPHYSQYNNWRACPELVNHHNRLAKLGLRDPWIRSYVFLFDPKTNSKWTKGRHLWELMRPGIVPGLALAATLIAIDEGYSYVKHGHTSWGKHH